MEYIDAIKNYEKNRRKLRMAGRKSMFDDYDRRQIKKLYLETGLSINKISKRFKVTHTTIARFLKKEGITK